MNPYDVDVPALLVTVGSHIWDYGALATVRSLGRVGIPVYATVPRLDSPTAASRYLTEPILWETEGFEPEAELLDGLRAAAQRVGRPAVAIAGDDETAVLLARHRDELSDLLILPDLPGELPARLASKSGLAELCAEYGAAAPRSATPADWAQVDEFVAQATFPLVLKNPEPFSRWGAPAVSRTTKVEDAAELREALADWRPGAPLLLQEYVPADVSEDWYAAGVFDRGEPFVMFSGRKLRSYPAGTGIGTLSESQRNPRLLGLAAHFAKAIGYAGVCDMDWRYDRRDDTYKLLDYNPRRGAQFRMFRTTADVDVVRALHLMLTGRVLPPGHQVDGVRHVVGVTDQRAYLSQCGADHARYPAVQRGDVERAWWAADDLRPVATFVSQLQVGKRLHNLVDRARGARRSDDRA